MKCRKATKMLPLLAGLDLSRRDLLKLKTHVAGCAHCAVELAAFRRSRQVAQKIAHGDTPDSLPLGFAARLTQQIVPLQSAQQQPDSRRTKLFRGRPLAVYAGFAVAAIVILCFSTYLLVDDNEGVSPPTKLVHDDAAISQSPSAVSWKEFCAEYDSVLAGPDHWTDWEPPGQAGVFVILHKPEPENDSATYHVAYCGESDRLLSFRGSPWVYQQAQRLMTHAGSADNIYIAVLHLPQSSRQTRREIKKAIILQYQPLFNRKNGV